MKKNKKKNDSSNLWLWIIVCFFIVSISSCKKDEKQYLDVDQSFREWVLFRKGSYWIYLNERSMKKDSSYLTNEPSFGYLPPDPDINKHYQQIYYQLENSFIKTVEIDRGINESMLAFDHSFPVGIFVTLFDGYTNGTSMGTEYNCYYIEKIDTMIINSNVFTNLIHTKVVIPNTLQYDYYFMKNVGWVKYSIKTNTIDTTWSLLRYHVIQ